jgi:RNA polymerase sigma factor (sigma-70 family)
MDACNRNRQRLQHGLERCQHSGYSLTVVHDLNLELAMQQMYPVLRQKAENVVHGKISHQIGLSDLAMNTIMVGLVRARDFQGNSQNHLERWLVGIMKNLYRRGRRDFFRRRKLESQYFKNQADHRNEEDLCRMLLVNRPNNPMNAACHEELLEFLQTAVNQLPYRLRQVIELRMNEGLSAVQIADRLEIEVEAASKRYQRAIDQLREMYVIRQIAETMTD